jgi:peptide/nickel transport system permease protein
VTAVKPTWRRSRQGSRIGSPDAAALAAGFAPTGARRAQRGADLSVPVTVFLLASFVTYALGAVGNANPAAEVLGDTATPADIDSGSTTCSAWTSRSWCSTSTGSGTR